MALLFMQSVKEIDNLHKKLSIKVLAPKIRIPANQASNIKKPASLQKRAGVAMINYLATVVSLVLPHFGHFACTLVFVQA